MTAIEFPEQTGTLGPPPGMNEADCNTIPVFRGLREDQLPVVITKWQLTEEEKAEIAKSGEIWLHILGVTMPPVCLTIHHPFIRDKPDGSNADLLSGDSIPNLSNQETSD